MLVLQQMIIFVLLMVVFTNIGFMGVPMIDGIYGKDALIYMTVRLIPFITRIYWLPAWPLSRRRLATSFRSWQPFIIKKPIPFPYRVSLLRQPQPS